MQGWKIGKVFGITIEIHFTWLIIFGLILSGVTQEIGQTAPDASHANLWTAAVITTLLFFVCLLLHELAHSVMANRLGAGVSRITLFVFGGVSQLKKEPDSPASEFKVAIVGPLTSIALAGLFYAIYLGLRSLGVSNVWVLAANWVARINLALAIFNMLPGFPLDGGRVLRSILWSAWNSLDRATRVAANVGQAFGYILVGLGFLMVISGNWGGLWPVALGWLLASAAAGSYQRVQLQEALGDVYVHDLMSSPVRTIPAQVTLSQAAYDYFMAARFTAFAVEQDGAIVGMIRMEQLQPVPRERWESTTVGEVMEPLDADAMLVNSDKMAVDAMMQMAEHDLGRLLVTDHSGNIIGIISSSDVRRLVRVKSGLGM